MGHTNVAVVEFMAERQHITMDGLLLVARGINISANILTG